MKRFAKWQCVLVLLAPCVLIAARPRPGSDDLHLRLVWRQQLGPSRVRPHSIFAKPSIINADFVVRDIIRNGELLVFDANGILTGTIPTSSEATLSFSPTNTAAVLTELKTDALSPGADDAPSALTGFVAGQQAWQRSSFATSTNLLADSGFSVELNEFIDQLRFLDSNGSLLKEVFPFGSPLPWSEERPAFGVFSADGSTFALLTTTSDSPTVQSVKLFVYDRVGNLKHSVDLPQLKLAQGIGISDTGTNTLVVGWTDNPVVSPQAGVLALIADDTGTISQHFTIPSIGFQVLVRPDATTGEFTLDTGDGTIIITGPKTPPSFLRLSTRGSNAVATNVGITAILSLVPKNKDQDDRRRRTDDHDAEQEFDVQIRILNQSGALLLERTLEGNCHGLVNPFIRLSKDGRFIAIQFSDEIRYYQLESEGD